MSIFISSSASFNGKSFWKWFKAMKFPWKTWARRSLWSALRLDGKRCSTINNLMGFSNSPESAVHLHKHKFPIDWRAFYVIYSLLIKYPLRSFQFLIVIILSFLSLSVVNLVSCNNFPFFDSLFRCFFYRVRSQNEKKIFSHFTKPFPSFVSAEEAVERKHQIIKINSFWVIFIQIPRQDAFWCWSELLFSN